MTVPDSAFYAAAWQRARESSSLYSHEKNPAAWQVFWDTHAPTYQKICGALMPANEKLTRAWSEKGLIDHSSRVLDIGCGPGTLALPLARIVKNVTALDTAALMLEILDREARRSNLNNIRPEQVDWKETGYQKEFDLVLAANSPAIHNMDTLMKMNEASKGYCMFICYAGGMGRSLRNRLWEAVMGEKIRGSSFDITFPFNILYREGYLPHVSFERQEYGFWETTDQLLQNYRAYFKIFGREGPPVDRVLRERLESMSRDGWIEESVSYNLAVMHWDVRERT